MVRNQDLQSFAVPLIHTLILRQCMLSSALLGMGSLAPRKGGVYCTGMRLSESIVDAVRSIDMYIRALSRQEDELDMV